MFQPTATIETLQARARIVSRLRQFFDARGFFEVETPVLSRDVVVDRYLEPIGVDAPWVLDWASASDSPFWLQTSPEFAMKRLVASGAEAIYQITRAFRAKESGQHHNPEFTMLEWYRIGDSPATAIALLGDLAKAILDRDRVDTTTYRQAFLDHADVDPLVSDVDRLQEAARRKGVAIEGLRAESDLDFWRNLLLTHVVEPNLGRVCPTIIYDWPASQAALAQVRDESPPVAERFELFVDGIELANGYHELLDADELCRRNRRTNELRVRDGNRTLPESSRLVEAMEAGLPDCCGVALGVDRLVMLALGKPTISDVMAFPIERA